MSSRIELPLPGVADGDRLARRSAVWQVFLRNLYGPPRGATNPRSPLGPLPDFEDLPAMEDLGWLSRSQLVARPHVLRRTLAPLVAVRACEPSEWPRDLQELVIAAFRDVPNAPRAFPEALARLRTWARERFAVEPVVATARDVRAALRLLDPDELLEAEPSRMAYADGIFTVHRRARVKAPFTAVRDTLNPENWMSMGEFFEYVGPTKEHYEPRENDGWSGRLEERFVVGWGPFRLSTCHPFLRVDFTFDAERARADYALLYEEDDQLECDDGYLEACRIPSRPGWVDYHAEKRTKFRSPMTNLFSPAVMAVFLESSLSSIEDVAYAAHERRRASEGA